jgi:hypothetical protein
MTKPSAQSRRGSENARAVDLSLAWLPFEEEAIRCGLLYGSSLDIPHIRRIVREFAEALEEVARVQTLDRLLCATGLGRP